MGECMRSLYFDQSFCQLADGHGGPHFDGGAWWEVRTDPPDWSPPRFTISVDVCNQLGRVLSTVVIDPIGPADLDLTPQLGLRLRFNQRRSH